MNYYLIKLKDIGEILEQEVILRLNPLESDLLRINSLIIKPENNLSYWLLKINSEITKNEDVTITALNSDNMAELRKKLNNTDVLNLWLKRPYLNRYISVNEQESLENKFDILTKQINQLI